MGQQHYRFAFGGLKQYAFERAPELEAILGSSELETFLPWLWEQCAVGASEPHPGLSASSFVRDGLKAAIFTLPEPSEVPEAFFVLVLFATPAPRVFSLEKASREFGGEGTCLAEWFPDRRENLGLGPAPDAASFVDAVFALLGSRV